jgi:hypothetical protein
MREVDHFSSTELEGRYCWASIEELLCLVVFTNRTQFFAGTLNAFMAETEPRSWGFTCKVHSEGCKQGIEGLFFSVLDDMNGIAPIGGTDESKGMHFVVNGRAGGFLGVKNNAR